MLTNVILDCERMKSENTGLYHYCYQLGKALQTDESGGLGNLTFYLPKTQRGIFGEATNQLMQLPFHRFLMPRISANTVWHCTNQSSLFFPFKSKAPIVYTIHDLNFLYDSKKSGLSVQNKLNHIQKCINRADYIVTISHYVMDDVKANFKLNNTPISVVYNGCNFDEQLIAESPKKQPRTPFLYTIGTISVKKNFHVLPALLVKNDWQLVISGIVQNESYKQLIISEATKLGVHDRIHFTGAVSEEVKKWYLSNCEAFVFPSLAEGFGLPVLEAMYFGKPVILSTCTSLPEVGGKEAYYFNNFQPNHMQQVLKETMGNYAENNPVEAIKSRALSFSWKQTASEYIKIYNSVSQ